MKDISKAFRFTDHTVHSPHRCLTFLPHLPMYQIDDGPGLILLSSRIAQFVLLVPPSFFVIRWFVRSLVSLAQLRRTAIVLYSMLLSQLKTRLVIVCFVTTRSVGGKICVSTACGVLEYFTNSPLPGFLKIFLFIFFTRKMVPLRAVTSIFYYFFWFSFFFRRFL